VSGQLYPGEPAHSSQLIRVSRSLRDDEDVMIKKKGNAVPLQAWSGPEGSRKLRFLHVMTTAQDGG
jgi:hypothetical protein